MYVICFEERGLKNLANISGYAIRDNLHIVCIQHCGDVIIDAIASQITSLTIVYWTVYVGADQRKHQSSASLAFVRGIHRWPVNSRHTGPVTRKMFPFDYVIMNVSSLSSVSPCTAGVSVAVGTSACAALGTATPTTREDLSRGPQSKPPRRTSTRMDSSVYPWDVSTLVAI